MMEKVQFEIDQDGNKKTSFPIFIQSQDLNKFYEELKWLKANCTIDEKHINIPALADTSRLSINSQNVKVNFLFTGYLEITCDDEQLKKVQAHFSIVR